METIKEKRTESRLLTRDFCCLSVANFLMFFSFYALMPLLPFYLDDAFGVNYSVAGIILASYSVACIVARPITGYLLDAFRQRPLYLLGYCTFATLFCGYAFAAALGIFILFRIAHGLAFGLTSVSGNTIASEIVPRSRIGEGLGIYGLSNTLAMCIGPMAGIALHGRVSYDVLFVLLFLVCLAALGAAWMVKVPDGSLAKRRKFSFRNLILGRGIWEAVSLLLASIPYGMTTAYIALYAEEVSIPFNSGIYYTVMAIGLGISRFLSGKWTDKGGTGRLIIGGLLLVVASYAGLSLIGSLAEYDKQLAVCAYICMAFVQGLSFGTLHPAFNTLLVKMASPERRGVATSTYQTAWDLGIGIGIFAGGYWADRFGGFYASYFIGACFALMGCVLFIARRQYIKNRQKS